MQLLIFEVFTCVNHFYPSQQSRIQLGFYPLFTLSGWWAQMDFLAFGCFTTKWPRHFAPILLAEFGGLKWTRTIDLTLIRRVL